MLWLTFAPITTVAARHFGVSVSTVGWLAEIFPLLYVVLALPAGVLLDRRFRWGLSAGATLTAVGALLRIGGGFDRVLIGQIVIAVAQPLILNSVTKLATEYLPARQRATGIALASASVLFGIVLAFLLGTVFDRSRDIPTLLTVSAVYAVVGAVVLPITLRRGGGGDHVSVAAGWGTLRGLWNDRVIRALAGLLFVGVGVFDALTTWLEALLDPAGVSAETSGLLLLELVIAGMLGAAILPPLAAARRLESPLLAAALVVTAVGCLALAITPGAGTGAAVMLLVGALLLTCLPVVLEIAERRAGAAGASAAALLWLAGNAGGLLVAVIVQALVDTPAAAFLAMAVVLLIAAPLTRPAVLAFDS
jgi:predicted MFS family arabinose efflux permease